MISHELRSVSGTAVELPDELFQETADLYFIMLGKGKGEAQPHLRHSPNLGYIASQPYWLDGALYFTNDMIGDTPEGEDIVWLAVARAVASKAGRDGTPVSDEVMQGIESAISGVAPKAQDTYQRKRNRLNEWSKENDSFYWLREKHLGDLTDAPINLGIELKQPEGIIFGPELAKMYVRFHELGLPEPDIVGIMSGRG